MSGIPQPDLPVLVALASIAVHVEEFSGSNGHQFDLLAIQGLLQTPGLQDYLGELSELGLTPVMRS